MTFQRLAFGAHDPEIVLVLELGLHCSSRALDSDKTFQPHEGWDLPSPAAAGLRRDWTLPDRRVWSGHDAERQTLSAERCGLAQTRFSSQKSKMPDSTGIALSKWSPPTQEH
jgi:hypothetical protein